MPSSVFASTVISLFPEMFPGPLAHSIAGRALNQGIWSLESLNLRDFSMDKHNSVDDNPFGGGVGMVIKPDVVDSAICHAKEKMPTAQTIYFTPRGAPITQERVKSLINNDLILLCGRFEGVDQRVIEHHDMLELSLGDFILSGGEIAALALLDACIRLLPGVLSKSEATEQESFSLTADSAGLLEYPHYTRPSLWNGVAVPDVLLSGNHERINAWRLEEAKKITASRRPDLLTKAKQKE